MYVVTNRVPVADGFVEMFDPEEDPEKVVVDFAESRVVSKLSMLCMRNSKASPLFRFSIVQYAHRLVMAVRLTGQVTG